MRSSVPSSRAALYAASLAAIALTTPAWSHHSDAALDMTEIVSFEGTVKAFTWQNPHAYFTVEVASANGEPIEWTVQLPSTITMSRRGWSRDTLAAGDQVSVSVHPARDGRRYGLFQSIEKADDAAASLAFDRTSGELRFENTAPAARTSTLDGKWLADNEKLSGFAGGLDNITRTLLKLTPAGAAAMAAYDENSDENPELQCLARPTPAMLIYTNIYPIEIEIQEESDTIAIRGQFFDEQRIVHMDGRTHPPDSVRFHEGHSIGAWENDTLVVDTRNFADHRSPYQNGIPSGAEKHVIERYRLIADGTRLLVEFMLEDPEYIAEPMTHARELIYSPQIEMVPFNCDLEVTRRFLPQ